MIVLLNLKQDRTYSLDFITDFQNFEMYVMEVTVAEKCCSSISQNYVGLGVAVMAWGVSERKWVFHEMLLIFNMISKNKNEMLFQFMMG